MNILFINKIDTQGGAAQLMWNLSTGLKKQGHNVRFIVRRKFSDDANVYELKEHNILVDLRKLFHRDITVAGTNLRDQISGNDIDHGANEEIINHPWVKWADVVHCHNLHGNYFKLETLSLLSKKKPVVWTLHDLWAVTGHCAQPLDCERYKKSCGECPYLKRYQKMYWDNSAYLLKRKKSIYERSKLSIVVPSNWMFHKVKEGILKNKHIKIISNAVNTAVYKNLGDKINIRQTLSLPRNKKIILFFTYGRENINKGWEYIEKMIHHYQNNNNILFLDIGTARNFTAKIENVKYIQSIDNPNLLVKYYNSADILLFPSLAESFGMVPLEAMSCGTPVIAFPVGAVPEMIDHRKNGYIAEYGNFSDLLRGMEFLLKSKTIAIKRIQTKFRLDAMVNRYISLYTSLI